MLVFFAGGGASIGYRMASLPGAVVGAVAGTLLRYVLGSLVHSESMHFPDCECGENDYESEYGTEYGIVEPCKGCSSIYVLRRGNTWYSVLDDGRLEKRMQRTFLGSWKPVND